MVVGVGCCLLFDFLISCPDYLLWRDIAAFAGRVLRFDLCCFGDCVLWWFDALVGLVVVLRCAFSGGYCWMQFGWRGFLNASLWGCFVCYAISVFLR